MIDSSRFDREVEFIRADGDFVFLIGLETVTPLRDAPGAGLAAGRTIERLLTNIWKDEGPAWRLSARQCQRDSESVSDLARGYPPMARRTQVYRCGLIAPIGQECGVVQSSETAK